MQMTGGNHVIVDIGDGRYAFYAKNALAGPHENELPRNDQIVAFP